MNGLEPGAVKPGDEAGAVRPGDEAGAARLETHRAELTGYCYRMLGSVFEAEDAVQETMVRAWRGLDRFEERSSLRSWVYRIATNVCLDALAAGKRRARPMDLSGPTSGATSPGAALDADVWIEPCPTAPTRTADNPAEAAEAAESVRLAFVAALQHLPAKQRATLLLREVMGFSAREVADLHGCTVASVNSALQRARATLAARREAATDDTAVRVPSSVQKALARRYAAAFASFDMVELSMLLHVDATMSLPPYAVWMRGVSDIRAWLTGPAVGCRGSRLIPTQANGSPAFGQYRPSAHGSGFEPWGLQVIDISGDHITDISVFRDTDRLFPLFDLPARIDA
ncbi:sigma-70 family RNA polymerase sigma factor [Streptomyces spirodelae]|uniref:Sigma-70 family RNA polymerase sigma factor n=1 Tax=Streptomyces spirodelae TaxID=2812904 RepID=A0ABS3X0L7_9ACTN|nr:sigma-70 family RNA polymerase sigma factor [Streptomyces spirodelae]MBO8188920.1 sigma-70 family RNA polymerase sigma factor [Streptomyces spirodelae]